ncbi:hypothetical protein [Arthrobacter sp. 754]|uniref:hypothetical protein n=1 Tax=Arthrobacter sp. 754 TaxID=3156315 RepID=UPI003394F4C9
MLNNLRLHSVLWAVTGLLALVAAVTGVAVPGIYAGVVSSELVPGAFSQDLISIVASVGLISVALAGGREQAKGQIIALGLLGYLFYAFGIYVIERTYNGFYLVYLAIFSLSFWALIAAGASLQRDFRAPELPRSLRLISASGALLQPMIFYPLWIGMLLPLMSSGNQIDSLYSIFILDLCFIMPGFLLLAILAYRSRPLGMLLLPALYVLGFALIFSLALGELVKPLFGLDTNIQSFWTSLVLSVFFGVLGALHLLRLELTAGPGQPAQRAAHQRHTGSTSRR